MSSDSWHGDFNPRKFLAQVDLGELLERNEAFDGSSTDTSITPCILCAASSGHGMVLNDRSFLCSNCYTEVELISYPERYEMLRRRFVVETAARKLARSAFHEAHEYRSRTGLMVPLGWLSALLGFVNPAFLAGTALLLVVGYYRDYQDSRRVAQWEGLFKEWDLLNPPPSEPELLHFHDPAAVLSERDRAILRIFNHWPGYPPFWNYLRAIVIRQDGGRCQVTGCPSRLELHVHHKQPVAEGGTHAPDNLVCLCGFHHALEPEKGHERIWGELKTKYFTLVCAHERSNYRSGETHVVRPHLRRLQLVTILELEALKHYYALTCPSCDQSAISLSLLAQRSVVRVTCGSCQLALDAPQQLTEETGPLLAEVLDVGRNKGRWKARWDMLAERKSGISGDWTGARVASRRRKHRVNLKTRQQASPCSLCGAPMKLVTPRPADTWKPFWGCTQYKLTGCRGSARFSTHGP